KDTWNSTKSSFTGYFKSAYKAVTNPRATLNNVYSQVKSMSAGEILTAPVRYSPGVQIISAEVKAIKATINGDGKALGEVIGTQAANTATVLVAEGAGAVISKGLSSLKGTSP